jgi:hypothetical protein
MTVKRLAPSQQRETSRGSLGPVFWVRVSISRRRYEKSHSLVVCWLVPRRHLRRYCCSDDIVWLRRFRPWPTYSSQSCVSESYSAAVNNCGATVGLMIFELPNTSSGSVPISGVPMGSALFPTVFRTLSTFQLEYTQLGPTQSFVSGNALAVSTVTSLEHSVFTAIMFPLVAVWVGLRTESVSS